MSFFKNIKNYITGGSAVLTINFPDTCHLRKPFLVNLNIQVKDKEINAKQVYIHLKYTEEVKATGRTHNSSGSSTHKTFHESKVLYEERINLGQDVLLEANQVYDYSPEIILPPEVFPSFVGVNAKLIWSVQAFIEVSGNDPNSEVVIFEPYYEIV